MKGGEGVKTWRQSFGAGVNSRPMSPQKRIQPAPTAKKANDLFTSGPPGQRYRLSFGRPEPKLHAFRTRFFLGLRPSRGFAPPFPAFLLSLFPAGRGPPMLLTFMFLAPMLLGVAFVFFGESGAIPEGKKESGRQSQNYRFNDF